MGEARLPVLLGREGAFPYGAHGQENWVARLTLLCVCDRGELGCGEQNQGGGGSCPPMWHAAPRSAIHVVWIWDAHNVWPLSVKKLDSTAPDKH